MEFLPHDWKQEKTYPPLFAPLASSGVNRILPLKKVQKRMGVLERALRGIKYFLVTSAIGLILGLFAFAELFRFNGIL